MAKTTQPATGPTHASPIPATEVAAQTPTHVAPNGIRFATFADTGIVPGDTHPNIEPNIEIDRLVQAVPTAIAAALSAPPSPKTYYFVPLALTSHPDGSATTSGHRGHDETMISPIYTPELADLAICHRNVELPAVPGTTTPTEGVFISTRLLSDRFALAFEFFINVGHAFVDTAGVPESFSELAWSQALADTRGETSFDAWESRNLALGRPINAEPEQVVSRRGRFASRSFGQAASNVSASNAPASSVIDEKEKTVFLESAFSDAVAIYLLSLALDFDYSELREREYPLLAPSALAARLKLVAELFPPNAGYEFAVKFRRRT